jgi:hypothetical protein
VKRYEQPPAGYFENFLHEFRQRQRVCDALHLKLLWRVCVEAAEDFALRVNIRLLASAGVAVVVAWVAVFSIRVHQQAKTTQFAVQGTPASSALLNAELESAPSALVPTLDMRRTLGHRSRDIRVLPTVLPGNPLRPDERAPLNLEWKSLDDQSLLPGQPP